MKRNFTAWVVGALALITVCQATAARAQNRKLAYTDPAQVDSDFAFQGEYLGHVFVDDTTLWDCWQPAAVQIVARGNGEFEVARYGGGLPGSGWDGSEPERLDAYRVGQTLRVSDGTQMTIQGGRATVTWHGGHDLARYGKVLRTGKSLGQAPPTGAVVLFDGSNTDKLLNAEVTPDGLLTQGKPPGVLFKPLYRDFRLHLEFRLPYMPHARGQARANSGVYIQSRYEVQILDSFGLEGAFNECGALYRTKPPRINMCLPPLQWQTYDIIFRSPRFDDDGNKTQDATIRVVLNSVVVHDDFAIPNKTGAGAKEGPELLPIKLQNHGDPVRFRNIWVLDLDESDD